MAKSLFKELGGKYERQGDYLISCITVPAEEEQLIGIDMDNAVNECIKGNILAEFLKKQKAEVVAVSIFEYVEEICSEIEKNNIILKEKMHACLDFTSCILLLI